MNFHALAVGAGRPIAGRRPMLRAEAAQRRVGASGIADDEDVFVHG